MEFPLWYSIGSYGGLICALSVSTCIAAYALLYRKGTPRQLARAILVCLVAGTLMLASIWWKQNRLDLYGPTLGAGEVFFWLSWTAICGWCMPLGMLTVYVQLAAPLATTASGHMAVVAGDGERERASLAAVHDPGRRIEPLGGAAWGRLVPLNGPFADQAIALTRQMTLLGRELDNDIVVDDERTSRHHADIRWDHGRAQLRDGNSMNGTLLNRHTVRGPTPLQSGDVLELGAQQYRFELLVDAPLLDTPPKGAGTADVDPAIDEHDTRKMPGATNGSSILPLPPLMLVSQRGSTAGMRWRVDNALATIGRDSEHDIALLDESVSRLHAQIVRQRDGYFVSDLRSSNGTFLNERQLTAPTLLSPGDLLRIGEIVLRCESATKISAPAPRAASTGQQTHGATSEQPVSAGITQSIEGQGAKERRPDALLLMQRVDASKQEDAVRPGPLEGDTHSK